MRRKRRIISRALDVLSLLMFTVGIGFLVRSQWASDRWLLTTSTTQWALYATDSALELIHDKVVDPLDSFQPTGIVHIARSPIEARIRERLDTTPVSFVRRGSSGISVMGFNVFNMPYFLLMSMGVVLPLRRMLWKRRKVKNTFCRTCGYDLRATPHRCPECGTVPEKPR